MSVSYVGNQRLSFTPVLMRQQGTHYPMTMVSSWHRSCLEETEPAGALLATQK